jgi:hypothetical protein
MHKRLGNRHPLRHSLGKGTNRLARHLRQTQAVEPFRQWLCGALT